MSCPANKIYNPYTGRCVLRNGAVGRSLLEGQYSAPAKSKGKGKPKNRGRWDDPNRAQPREVRRSLKPPEIRNMPLSVQQRLANLPQYSQPNWRANNVRTATVQSNPYLYLI
jgi:hypothetical protein